MKKILRLIIPPIILILIKKLLYANNPDVLFDGDDTLFKEKVLKSCVYGEYGCGKSTQWVLQNSLSRIISVDSSKIWIRQVNDERDENNRNRLDIHYVDVGEVSDWGHPVGYSHRHNFQSYTDYIWEQDEKPDCVLIDGRFRVCCFLTSLKFADPGTNIIFDDYTDRQYYHFVEKYVSPVSTFGRQCLFVVPAKNNLDLASLTNDIEAFRYVID